MRTTFDTQLMQLHDELITMGALCEDAISLSLSALEKNDLSIAEKVVSEDKNVDQKERDIEALCLKMLLQQQPVAGDLRLISAALKMITDMERIGDQAADHLQINITHLKDMGTDQTGVLFINDPRHGNTYPQ